ncbi:MAG: glycosyltransferase family 39 protein [Acidobacteriaceae bacterium]|nr:glycosyltransferase family 39 protein [Acidobacteriaceae bacterium]
MPADSLSEPKLLTTLDNELEALPASGDIDDEQRGRNLAVPVFWSVIAGLTFLSLIVILQVASGAYTSEFGVYADEASHYVTSLMVWDYIAHFHFEPPIRFAQEYYHHYPKVAIGHWPPFFYVVQAFWIALFSPSRASVRLEVACTTALVAYVVFREARQWFGWKLGFFAGLLTLCLPIIQTYSDEEMAEALLTLMCFGSTVFFAQYVDSGRWRDGLLFGGFFSLAVLTKGSGWLLAIVPPVTLMLTRDWKVLRRLSFWVSLALVSILCVPWQLMTMRLVDQGWDGGSKPNLSYTLSALGEFLGLFPSILGPVLLTFMLVGIAVLIVRPFLRGRVPAHTSAMFALILGVWIFHSLVPAGVEDRKLVIAVPAMVLFTLGGIVWVANQIPRQNVLFRWRWLLVGGVATISFFVGTFYIPRVPHYGFIEAARFLTTRPEFKSATVLVSSESSGEGMLISEVAMRQPQPSGVILRGTKFLANMEWNAAHYHSFYSTPSEILHCLEGKKVQFVVMDSFASQVPFPHHELLRKTIQQSKRFQLLATFPDHYSKPTGKVSVYKFEM